MNINLMHSWCVFFYFYFYPHHQPQATFHLYFDQFSLVWTLARSTRCYVNPQSDVAAAAVVVCVGVGLGTFAGGNWVEISDGDVCFFFFCTGLFLTTYEKDRQQQYSADLFVNIYSWRTVQWLFCPSSFFVPNRDKVCHSPPWMLVCRWERAFYFWANSPLCVRLLSACTSSWVECLSVCLCYLLWRQFIPLSTTFQQVSFHVGTIMIM